MNIEKGLAYYWHSEEKERVFISAREGPKYYTGLVIEADGLHVMTIKKQRGVRFAETGLTSRRVRGWLRKIKPATKGARKLRQDLLQSAA